MELSEVVNPHFAFPVVGVVLCAFLVFAFGFKSPVQPPSFDNFGEERKPRKSKHKKKSHTSDNLENRDVAEKSSTVQRQTTASKQTTPKAVDKSPQPQKEAKTKTRKSPAVKQPPPDNKQADPPRPDNEGGWETVSVSKKKKNKTKKESDSEIDVVIESPKIALSVYNKPPAVIAPVENLEVDLEIPQPQPQPQRSKKDKASKATVKDTDKQAPSDQSDKENTPEPQTEQQETDKPTSSDLSDKENTPEPQTQEVTKHIRKKESKKAKTKLAPEPLPVDVQSSKPPGDSAIVKPEKKSKSKNVAATQKEATPQKEPEVSASITAQPTVSQSNVKTESKVVKSLQSKKVKQKKEVSHPPVTDSTATSLTELKSVTTSPSPSQSNVTSAQVEVNEIISETAVSQDTGTKSNADAKPETTNSVTFDEIGDWQAAKPTKKRKTKARRDN